MKLKSACSGAWIALLAAAVDRVGKSLMLRHEPGEIVRVIPGIVQFRRTANTGMAFSLFSENGAALTILAFSTVLGRTGAVLVCVCVTLFAFSTIIGWAYQGETAFGYLTGGRGLSLYRTVFALTAFWGAVVQLETVFRLADICNALMALPNLLCLLLLSGTAAKEARNFQIRLKAGGRK